MKSSIHPPLYYPLYKSTEKRSPRQPLISLDNQQYTIGPRFSRSTVKPLADMTIHGNGEALGERMRVSGRVMDRKGRPLPNILVEVWQANAAGRYLHSKDDHQAPLDPHFTGEGRMLTDDKGEYSFLTIKPGAYPWGNHHNAWRPAHIHFSVFGPWFSDRLITQMYFPRDPLLAFDPIYNSVPDEVAKRRLVSSFDMDLTEPGWALGYRFDITLEGDEETPFENNL